jgi:hypothetical protein
VSAEATVREGMTRQIEVVALSSRVVRVAAPLAMLVVIIHVAVVLFQVGLRRDGAAIGAFGLVTVAGLLWLELRSPRFIVLREGVVELHSVTGTVVIRDGELVSLREAPLGRVHPWAEVSRVVIRFPGGRRTFATNFREFDLLLEELRSRNPEALVLKE